MEKQDSLERWRTRVSEKFAFSGEYVLDSFVSWIEVNGGDFAGYDLDGLVEYQKASPNSFDILDLVQKWIGSLEGLRASTKKTYYVTVKSLFSNNRAPLPEDNGFKIRSKIPPVRSRLDIEKFRKVLLACKPRYRAAFLSMFQAGLDVSSFNHWNLNGYADLEKKLKGSPDCIRIELPGRKGSKNVKTFYTFIGHDSIKALRDWLREREKIVKRKGEDCGAIFISQFGTPVDDNSLRLYWLRQLKRLGLIVQKGSSSSNRYGMNLHELRDLMKSRWRLSGVDSEIVEFFLGHTLDKLGYDKSPRLDAWWFEEQYNAAQPWLNILSEDPQTVSRREVNAQQRRIRELETKLTQYETRESNYSDLRDRLESYERKAQERDEVIKRLFAEIEELKKRE